jgi:hypothetical protein
MVTFSEELEDDKALQPEQPLPPSKEEIEDQSSDAKDEWQKLMGDDLQMKVIKSEKLQFGGDQAAAEEIEPKDTVLIDVVGRFAETKDMTDGPIFQQVKGWLVVVGDGDVLPAVEMGIRFLKSGQTGLIWSHSKFAMGPGIRTYQPPTSATTTKIPAVETPSSYTLPPHSNVMYEVTVAQKVMDTSRLNPYFTIQKALTRKNIANDIFQNEWKVQSNTLTNSQPSDAGGEEAEKTTDETAAAPTTPLPPSTTEPDVTMAMSRAIRLYQKAAKDMEALLQGTYFASVEAEHPQRIQARQLMLDCLNNIIAVHMRSEDYHPAKQAAIQVLQHDAKNLKALLRAAKAALLDPASTMEEAAAALQAAENQIVYKDVNEEKELKRLRQLYKRKQVEYKTKSKEMFGNKLKAPNALGTKDDDNNNNKDEINTNSHKKKETEEDETADTPLTLEDRDESHPNNSSPVEGVGIDKSNLTRMTSTLVDDDAPFWKSQIVSIGIQVTVVLVAYLLFQWFVSTTKLAVVGGVASEQAAGEL